MLDREVFSCIPFSTWVPFLCLFAVRSQLLIFARNHWNWSLNFWKPNCSSCEQQYCIPALFVLQHLSNLFLTVTSIPNPLQPIQLVFLIRDVLDHHLSNVLVEFVTLHWLLEEFSRKSKAVWSTAGNCEAEWGILSQTRVITLLQDNVIENHCS